MYSSVFTWAGEQSASNKAELYRSHSLQQSVVDEAFDERKRSCRVYGLMICFNDWRCTFSVNILTLNCLNFRDWHYVPLKYYGPLASALVVNAKISAGSAIFLPFAHSLRHWKLVEIFLIWKFILYKWARLLFLHIHKHQLLFGSRDNECKM